VFPKREISKEYVNLKKNNIPDHHRSLPDEIILPFDGLGKHRIMSATQSKTNDQEQFHRKEVVIKSKNTQILIQPPLQYPNVLVTNTDENAKPARRSSWSSSLGSHESGPIVLVTERIGNNNNNDKIERRTSWDSSIPKGDNNNSNNNNNSSNISKAGPVSSLNLAIHQVQSTLQAITTTTTSPIKRVSSKIAFDDPLIVHSTESDEDSPYSALRQHSNMYNSSNYLQQKQLIDAHNAQVSNSYYTILYIVYCTVYNSLDIRLLYYTILYYILY
jgi:hypothetical protein